MNFKLYQMDVKMCISKWIPEWRSVYWTPKGFEDPHFLDHVLRFSMMYGAEAVIPLQTGFLMPRTSSFAPSNNDELLGKSLDLIEEQRENAMVQLAYYQHKLK